MAFDLTRFAGTFAAHSGEWVTYIPRESATARKIKVTVNRNPPTPLPGAGHTRPTAIMQIMVRNDMQHGIHATEIDTGGDAVELATREGGETQRRMIASIVSQDAGHLVLEVR